jgi:hypothetical protein
MSDNIAVTTVDNPFNPFKDSVAWFKFDMLKGENSCCSTLARIAASSDNFDDEAEELATEMAIDDMVLHHPLGIYLKVKETPSGDMEVVKPVDYS